MRGMDLEEPPRGAEKTKHRNIFRIGLEDEDTAHRMRLMYSVKTERSIMVPHRDKNGVETLVAYVFSKVLIPPMGVREESITIEILPQAITRCTRRIHKGP